MNQWLGRKKTIFVTCAISFITCIWAALTNSWWHLFISRFFLGVGIGPKSATVPVYTAECSPASIRGALVMMWQMWTAFGICLGSLVDLAFYFIPDSGGIKGLNWRLMLASAGIPGLIVCFQIFWAPESPRWLISKGRYDEAFKELCRLRFSPVQAARDLYYIHVLLEAENVMKKGRNRVVEMFTIPRNRNAALASWIVMFGQQFCGVNVIGMIPLTCLGLCPQSYCSILLLEHFLQVWFFESLCTCSFRGLWCPELGVCSSGSIHCTSSPSPIGHCPYHFHRSTPSDVAIYCCSHSPVWLSVC